MHYLRICLLLLVLQIPLQAQTIQITRILDSNRFFTSDSQTISLANVVIPSQESTDTLQAMIARRAVEFAQLKLKGYRFTYVVAHSVRKTGSSVKAVYLFKEFPLEKQFINAFFLEQGLGTYAPPADSAYAGLLKMAEDKAKQKGRGLWNPLALKRTRTWQWLSLFYGAGVNSAYSTEFRSYGLRFETRSATSTVGFALGYRKTAEQGTGCCECDLMDEYDAYTEYLVYFRRLYLSISYQYFWKYLSVGWVGNVTVSGGGFCSESLPFPYITNSLMVESMPVNHYMLTWSYSDEFVFDYGKNGFEKPMFIGIGRRSGSGFASYVWAGLSWSDNHFGAAFKYEQRLLKKLFVQVRGGFVPNKGNVFMRLYTGYLFE